MGILLGVALLLAVAWLANTVAKGLMLSIVQRIAKRTSATWDDRLVERGVFHRVANIAPALVIYYGIGPALGVGPDEVALFTERGLTAMGATGPLMLSAIVAERVALAWIILAVAMAVKALLDALDDIYRDRFEDANRRPIKGYLQVVAIFVYGIAAIVVIAILADQSPLVFLSGLGALTAVLLLVFRDTILSLVASVQLMSNDMIRVGDWVEMPQNNADGDVVDIALHTVKIQNWDKTISTVPTHKFISESFKNWRGMSEAGGRRIKRSLHLDMNTVHFLDDDEIERLGRFELLRGYMEAKRDELGLGRRSPASDGAGRSDGAVIPERRRLTNVGTFRAYVFEYLKARPDLHDDMTLLVRQLDPTPEGLPIQIYCFTKETAWAAYEGIQSDIFDHLIAVLPDFGLGVYQRPAGRDLQALDVRSHGEGEEPDGSDG